MEFQRESEGPRTPYFTLMFRSSSRRHAPPAAGANTAASVTDISTERAGSHQRRCDRGLCAVSSEPGIPAVGEDDSCGRESSIAGRHYRGWGT
jgi:hypothetical protein